ncbi:MAG: rod shape-determining protein RodA [Rickettsiales bacterium]|jgi:rod shape determining protein RodA|nr:rod shape-determining protein RodA [Rickettsiales bacterium]
MSYNTLRVFWADKIPKINVNMILTVCTIFSFGVAMLYSVGNGSMRPWALRQIIHFIISFPLCLIIAVTDINFWFKNSYRIYAFGLILLVIVEISGYRSMGATRWLNLGFTKIQPSEFIKIFTILALARYFFQTDLKNIQENKTLLVPIMLILVPCGLILRQPNLGTALILMAVGVSIMFFVGVQVKKFFICLFLILLAAPVLWQFALRDYQKQRIMVFLDPDSDPLNSGYNIMQSKIAIGSGGFWGKGFIKGTQGQLEFLPERHTDFIFTVFCEEFGFMGGVLVIFLYLLLFSMFIHTIIRCNNTFGKTIVAGVLVNFFCHFFINIGMIIGLLPVVGTPLILFSYGGSVTVSSLISISFVLNVQIHSDREIKNLTQL